MNTKSEWQSVHQQLMADERRRLQPPTAEEMLAYTRGELTAEEEASIQERLACYPELARTLTAEFPSEGAEPGEADYLSDEEYAVHWKRLQARMRPAAKEGRVVQFPRWIAGIAAAIAIATSVAWWQATIKLAQPRIVGDQQVLYPDGRRGAQQTVALTGSGESVLLAVPLIGQHDFANYRLELVETRTKRTLWKSGPLGPPPDETFAIVVPRRFLQPGVYQIAVYGVSGATEEPLATYSFRAPARP